MNQEDLVTGINQQVAQALAPMASADQEEVLLRSLYPVAGYRDPHPVFQVSKLLLTLALERGASELQLVPSEEGMHVLLRIENQQERALTLPKALQEAITSRIKDAANLDVTQRTSRQEGVLPVHWRDQVWEVSVVCVPLHNGEHLQLRFVAKPACVAI